MARGIKTFDDLAQRCEIDPITECWVWQGAQKDGVPFVRCRAVAPYPIGLGRLVGFLKTGDAEATGKGGAGWVAICGNKMCGNPDHRKRKPKNAERRGRPVNPIVRARITRAVRAKSALTDEMVQQIRDSDLSRAELAEKFGISRNYVNAILRGDRRAPMVAHGSSVFAWRGGANA